MKKKVRAYIYVFGDSVAKGAFDLEKGGWAQRLSLHVDKEFSFLNKNNTGESFSVLYNLGVYGDTTEDILKRFELELSARLDENEKTDRMLIFAVGKNDTLFLKLNKSKENIQRIIDKAKGLALSEKIMFVELAPVDEDKVAPIPWDPEYSYLNKNIIDFNGILNESCQKNKVKVVKIFDDWYGQDYKKFLIDGIHPNEVGHQKIFEKVLEKIKEIIFKKQEPTSIS